MNLPKNLVIALIGLACYIQCNNINLANNGTIMVIVLAMLLKCKEEEAENELGNGANFQNNNYPNQQNSNSCHCNQNCEMQMPVTFAQPFYGPPTYLTTNQPRCCHQYQTATPYATTYLHSHPTATPYAYTPMW